jgi:murein DD-endopeptidase MepM/ murein hydrolase activator NlpD
MPDCPWRALAAPLGLTLALACGGVSDLSDQLFDRRSQRQRYQDGFERAGLGNTAVFQDWVRAGARALADAPLVRPPHREEVHLPPTDPAAIGLEVELRRGQLATFSVEMPGDTTVVLFLEAWRSAEPGDTALELVKESEPGERSIAFEPRRDGRYLFRAQPELLRGGRFAVSLVIAPTLAFPVQGKGEGDIQSRWGAVRDGGRRSHQGIDIFAPRGTAVLAAGAGRVAEVGENELGGNVVWVRDQRGNIHYYAHLSAQLVVEGQEVEPGDTVGLVGNTGNARTTPPHLHFGIYRRDEGAVDPFWFLHNPPDHGRRVRPDTTLLARRIRAIRSAVVRSAPLVRSDTVIRLPPDSVVQVLSAIGSWLRVRTDDGTTGFLEARQAQRVPDPPSDGPRGTGVAGAGASPLGGAGGSPP